MMEYSPVVKRSILQYTPKEYTGEKAISDKHVSPVEGTFCEFREFIHSFPVTFHSSTDQSAVYRGNTKQKSPKKGVHRVGVYFLHQCTPHHHYQSNHRETSAFYTCTATGENRHFPFLHAFIHLTCCYRPTTIGDQRDKTTFFERDPVTSHYRPHPLSLNGYLVASC